MSARGAARSPALENRRSALCASQQMITWLKFNAVGAVGVAVQLAALAVYLKLGLNYLVATALAVETALLHNFFWHRRWTWRGRASSLLRFQFANGLVSIISNTVLMRALVGWLGLPPLAANPLAIALSSLINFALGDRFVFSPQRSPRSL